MSGWVQDPEAIRAMLSGRHRETMNGSVFPMLATVSGVVTTQTALIEHVDRELPAFGVVTTKSFQVSPNPGNREPIICEMEAGSFGNSVGLRNPGAEVALGQLRRLRATTVMRTLLNVSVSASSVEDFIMLVGAFEEVADIIELNFSCPHAKKGYGSSIGCSADVASCYMKSIRESFPRCRALLFPKLTPNVPDIGAIARGVAEAGADGITAINTVGPDVHVEPTAGVPILQNSLGGKGGKSGLWIFDTAVACMRSIRDAVGPNLPVIGMGGVATGAQVASMVSSGADVVGIGSAFAKVHQRDWRSYSDALVADARSVLAGSADPATAFRYRRTGMSMQYERHEVLSRHEHSADTVVLTLDGKWPFDAGQFVFLWMPGIGEKPFSIAEADPLTFVIKRRGPFTEALCSLKVGDGLYARGLYGEAAELDDAPRALLVAGGTGVAVLPALARRLCERGTSVESFIGTSEPDAPSVRTGLLEPQLAAYGPVATISDDGIPGRVLDFLDRPLSRSKDLACYVVGPTAFMRAAARRMADAGVPEARIHLSLELNTLCGIGMCGACACADRLTCQWGTFVSYAYVKREAPELL